MGARMRTLDWTKTPLGPPELWPQSLKTIVRVMLDSRYAMWMLWGPDLTFFCNDAYLPTVGMKRDWVLGARSDKVWEEIWPDIGPRIARVLEQGEATWDEGLLLFLERSGFPEETYHTFSYSPVYDDDERIAGMLCVVTEVTERVLGERGLGILRDMAARSAGAHSVSDTCQRLLAVLRDDPADVPFARLYLTDQNTGQATLVAGCGSLPRALDPERFSLADERAPWPIAQAIEGNEALLLDLPTGPAGVHSPLWADPVNRALVIPVKTASPGGGAVLVAGASPRRAFDDSYRRFFDLIAAQLSGALIDAQAHEAERTRAEELAALDRAKTQFFSNVSHEFRTPLTLLLGPVEELLASAELSQDARERLELAHRNSLRLQKLVNSLLDFSRIEAGRARAAYERVDLPALTRDISSTFRSAMERAGLAFTVSCEPLGEAAYVDREMWEKIVLNLLSNAFKFTLEGAVAVRLHRDRGHAVLEVADTGVGVPEDEIPRLFDRFHRVESTRGRTHEGSGIGLALVHELLKLHSGTVEAQSVLGQGTTFRVRLPLGREHLPPDQVRSPRSSSAPFAAGAQAFVQEALKWVADQGIDGGVAGQAGDASPPTQDRRFASTFGARIVLADDNADMRAYVTELLTPQYFVETVSDGEQALRAARRQRPDLIVSDIMMPALDGFGLLKALRADDALRSIPLILLSARAGEESRIEGLDAGADDYLIKPFSARELMARVGAMLERQRLHQQALEMERKTQQAFRQRTEQFETLLVEAPLGVYLVDADFRLREINPTAWPAFGEIPDLVGRDLGEVLRIQWPPAYADEVVRIFRHTLESGEPYYARERTETRLDRGIAEFYEWQVNRIPLPDGRFGVVCYFRDISAHVQARLQLENADRQKDEFLAMLAHELRNPLAPIRNAGELLSRSLPSDTRAQAAVEIVKRQVSHLTRLVDDLLDVSRITQGRIELRRRPVPLSEVISQALETVEPLLREKRHKVSVTQGFEHMKVNGDSARLVQCMANVLTNAAKYTDAGGEIRVESRREMDFAHITVVDNGPGISAELLPHVFELFVQGQRTLDRSQGGLGIGLSVVKRLINMHGGEAAVSSEQDCGTTFEIRLPLIAGGEEPAELHPEQAVAPRRILIVDDNIDAAESLAMLLAMDGHSVRTANLPEDALERVISFRPDIVLLDIGLPEIDGYEVARRIRALPDLAPLRLVALTGYGQAEDKRRTEAAGFDDHLVKPVDLSMLQRTLSKL